MICLLNVFSTKYSEEIKLIRPKRTLIFVRRILHAFVKEGGGQHFTHNYDSFKLKLKHNCMAEY